MPGPPQTAHLDEEEDQLCLWNVLGEQAAKPLLNCTYQFVLGYPTNILLANK